MSRSTKLYIFLLFAIVAVTYFNSLGNGFVWDDNWLIEKNPSIRSFANIPAIFSSHLGSVASPGANNYYRPMQELSFMVDSFLWGDLPAGYRITNIFLHFLVTVAVFLVGIEIFKNRLGAFIGAAFFAVNTVHTQAITYIAGRADPLMALFGCLSLYFFIKARRDRREAFQVLSLLFFVLALLSKEAAVMIPFIMGVYLVSFGAETPGKTKIKALIPFVVIAVYYIVARATFLDFSKPLATTVMEMLPLGLRFSTFLKALPAYVGLLAFPLNLHMERESLSAFSRLGAPDIFIALLVVAAAASIFWTSYKKDRRVFFLFCWFVIGLLPMSNIYPINATMSENWLYFPSIGLFLVFGNYAGVICQRRGLRVPVIACLSLALVFYSYQTVLRNRDWKDEKTLYENTLERAPRAYKVWNNLGTYYNKRKAFDSAIECFKKAIEIKESYYLAYDNMSYSYFRKGDASAAADLLQGYLSRYPQELRAWMRLAFVYEKANDSGGALSVYKKALVRFPGNAGIIENIKRLE